MHIRTEHLPRTGQRDVPIDPKLCEILELPFRAGQRQEACVVDLAMQEATTPTLTLGQI